MKISYANNKVRKYFEDYSQMKKKLPFDWVKTIKKHIDRLKAAEYFGDFLTLNLGHPEYLEGYKDVHYSVRVDRNVRMIITLDATPDTVLTCTEIIVEGVCDYHGGKENWYIP